VFKIERSGGRQVKDPFPSYLDLISCFLGLVGWILMTVSGCGYIAMSSRIKLFSAKASRVAFELIACDTTYKRHRNHKDPFQLSKQRNLTLFGLTVLRYLTWAGVPSKLAIFTHHLYYNCYNIYIFFISLNTSNIELYQEFWLS
jgi:hypothetical protein